MNELVLLLAGAGIGVVGTVLTTELAQHRAAARARRDQQRDQTRAALQASLEVLQRLYDAQRTTVPDELRAEAVTTLRANAVMVGPAELRDRLKIASEALQYPDAMVHHNGTGLHYLIRYLYDEMSLAGGAYLRGEPIPIETMQFTLVRDALTAAYENPEQC